MEPVYISIEAAARLVNRSRSSVKRWLKECRDLIDAGQEPLFAFIDPKDGKHGRVDIHRESFLSFRASEHRRRRTPPRSTGPIHAPPRDMPSCAMLFANLPADALPSRAIKHDDHVLLAISGGGVRLDLVRMISSR